MPASGVRLEGLVHHDGAQVGAADADVDHGFDLLAGHTGPLAGTDLVGEGVDAVEHLAHVLDGVLTVNDGTCPRLRPGGAARCAARRGLRCC